MEERLFKHRRWSSGVLCAALVAGSSLALMPAGARAAGTINCTLGDVEAAALSGGTLQFGSDCQIDFSTAPGGGVVIPAGTNLTLDANGNSVQFSGGDVNSFFAVDGTLTLNGIDMLDGHDDEIAGAIYVPSTGALTLNNSTISYSSAGGALQNGNGNFGIGGAIFSSGSVTLNNSTLSYNSAGGGPGFGNIGVGGGIASVGGAGIPPVFPGGTGRLTINNSTIRDNTAGGGVGDLNVGLGGGVVYAQLAGLLGPSGSTPPPAFSLTNSRISYNTAGGADATTAYGAAGGLLSIGTTTGSGDSIDNNTAGSSLTSIGIGGGAFSFGTLSLTNSEVRRNIATANGTGLDLGPGGINVAVGGGIVSVGFPTTISALAKQVTGLSANGGRGTSAKQFLNLLMSPFKNLSSLAGSKLQNLSATSDASAKAADAAFHGAPLATVAATLPTNGGLTLTQTTLADNTARAPFALGGGLFSLGTAGFNASTVSNNTAFGTGTDPQNSTTLGTAAVGGGIVEVGGGPIQNFIGLGGLFVLNSTIANNIARTNTSPTLDVALGGGIALLGTANMANATVSGNRTKVSINGLGGPPSALPAISDGGDVFVSPSFSLGGPPITTTFNTKNSIYAGGQAVLTASTGTGPDVFGSVTSGGYNLIQNPAGSTGFTGTGDLTGVNPKLGKLQNNGGPVIFPNGTTGFASGPGDPSIAGQDHIGPTQTEALLTGSPAKDQIPVASCTDLSTPPVPLTVDQRNFLRPFPYPNGNCDIGAYEVSQSADTGSCSVFIGFFSGSDYFATRTGGSLTTLINYLNFNGPGGLVRALPLVPRLGVPNTLQCFVPIKPATSATAPALVRFNARVVASGRSGFNVGDTLAISIVRIPGAGTQSATITDLQTNAVASYTSQFVRPQTFVIAGTQ